MLFPDPFQFSSFLLRSYGLFIFWFLSSTYASHPCMPRWSVNLQQKCCNRDSLEGATLRRFAFFEETDVFSQTKRTTKFWNFMCSYENECLASMGAKKIELRVFMNQTNRTLRFTPFAPDILLLLLQNWPGAVPVDYCISKHEALGMENQRICCILSSYLIESHH